MELLEKVVHKTIEYGVIGKISINDFLTIFILYSKQLIDVNFIKNLFDLDDDNIIELEEVVSVYENIESEEEKINWILTLQSCLNFYERGYISLQDFKNKIGL